MPIQDTWKGRIFLKNKSPTIGSDCVREDVLLVGVWKQSKEQQQYGLTALPSPWLAGVQREKPVKLKEWM